ncbi:hypothetical protein Tco_0040319 [Tanacetum coccineum]
MLITQAQEEGVVLDKEQQDFLADSLEETNDCEDLQLQATTNFKADRIDAYDSDYDDEATANVIFMVNLSCVASSNNDTVEPRYDSDIVSDVPHYDTYHDTGHDEDNYVLPSVQKNDMILSIIEQMQSQVDKCNTVNREKQSMNESLTIELERYKDKVRVLEYVVKDGHFEQEAYLIRELYTAISDSEQLFWSSTSSPPINVSKPTNFFPKELPSNSQVLKNLNTASDLLTKFDDCIKRRTALSPHDIGFIAEGKEMKDIFEQMEDEVDQCSMDTENKDEERVTQKAFPVIMEHLVKISIKARNLELKRRHLNITVLTANTPYPAKKIRCIPLACTSTKYHGSEFKSHYAVSRIAPNTSYPD